MTKKTKIIAAFAVVVVLGLIIHWFINHGRESTDDAMIEAHVIPIASEVSGYIVKLNIDDNQIVKKGDVLAEIDSREYAFKRDAARASLASAEAVASNAAVNARRQAAIGKAAGTQREIDNASATELQAKASVDNAKAQLALAEKDFADTKIIAPEDGVITMRTAERGAYITPGAQLFTLVGVDRWVVAAFKEVQITDMLPGQPVDISVDAYPSLKLKGKIDSVQRGTGARFSAFPPENATGNFVKIVQRVPVKILITSEIPQGVVLGPGLSVEPTVHTDVKPENQPATETQTTPAPEAK